MQSTCAELLEARKLEHVAACFPLRAKNKQQEGSHILLFEVQLLESTVHCVQLGGVLGPWPQHLELLSATAVLCQGLTDFTHPEYSTFKQEQGGPPPASCSSVKCREALSPLAMSLETCVLPVATAP